MPDILVVEDNPVNRRLVQSILARAGYDVTVAEDGRQALGRLREAGFTLVLLDLSMPVMDGWETIAALRADQRWKSLPVIAVTIDTSDGIKKRVAEAGFTDYIGKPYTREDLLERVRFHLGGTID